MVQKKLTENFPKRRSTVRSPPEKRKAKPLRDLGEEAENVFEEVDENSLECVRKALDTSSPENLPGREVQIERVYQFVNTRLLDKRPGSLYISGAPGTGKTAVVRYVLEKIGRERQCKGKSVGFNQLFVNCMCKRSAKEILEAIWDMAPKSKVVKGVTLKDRVEEKLKLKSKNSNMIVVVLDEMDQIMKDGGASNEVLYALFEWARSPNYRLILVGIANALDLTVRHLPFLHLNASPVKRAARGAASQEVDPYQCQTMNFPPYQREDIERIIQERMEQVGQSIFNPAAIKFVAGKVAASTGDARKALHACREALVSVEKQEQQRSVLQTAADNNAPTTPLDSSSSPPKRTCIRNEQIGIVAVSKALQLKKDEGPLPLQQTTILAALLKIFREAPNMRDTLVDGVNKPIPLATLYRQYRKICSLKGFSWIEESELPLVCEVLQDRSLVSVVNTGASSKKLSFGSKKFGSPSAASSSNKIGIIFDPRAIEQLVVQGDLKNLFG